MKGTIKIMMLSLVVLLLGGCWSSKEIEDLGLIAGTAMDLEKDGELKEKLEADDKSLLNRPIFTLTNQFVTSSGTGAGKTENATAPKSYINISETGDSILPTLRNMTLKIEKRAFAEHEKVIIIGADLARKVSLEKALDFFIREQEMRPSCLVMIAKGKASKVLVSKKPIIPAFHLYQITQGEKRNAKIVPAMPLGKLEGKMNSGSSFLIQNVSLEEGEAKFSGAAIIKGKTKKLLGFLNEKEVEGLAWIAGTVKGGVIRSIDKKSGQPIIYEMLSLKSSIKPHLKGNQLSFHVNIQSEGRIAENWVSSGDPFKNEFLKRAETAAKNQVKQLIQESLQKTQHHYKVDVAGFGNQLRIQNPAQWKKHKKNWDQTFSQIPITYHIKITIKDYGMSG